MEWDNIVWFIIDWDYTTAHVDISITGYIMAALHEFQHTSRTKPQDSPHAWNKKTYTVEGNIVKIEVNSKPATEQ